MYVSKRFSSVVTSHRLAPRTKLSAVPLAAIHAFGPHGWSRRNVAGAAGHEARLAADRGQLRLIALDETFTSDRRCFRPAQRVSHPSPCARSVTG